MFTSSITQLTSSSSISLLQTLTNKMESGTKNVVAAQMMFFQISTQMIRYKQLVILKLRDEVSLSKIISKLNY